MNVLTGGVNMAETQKAKIARLEKELVEEKTKLQQAYESSEEIYNKLLQLQELADHGFEASPHYQQLLRENERLKAQCETLENQLKTARERASRQAERLLRGDCAVHNARGAGRKRKFTDGQIEDIRLLRAEGLTFAKIAEKVGCSVGLVHKIINENK